jgi:hypothetical protein
MTNTRTKRGTVLAALVCAAVLARSAAGQDMIPPPPMPDPALLTPPPPPPDPFPPASATFVEPVVIPEHLVFKDQHFDASPYGLRRYLDTIRPTNPQLYAQLAPDVDRLESRMTASALLLGAGLIGTLATMGYAVATQKNCTSPSLSDPNFAADAQAWGQCNSDNTDRLGTYGLASFLVGTAGIVAFFATMPRRQDLLDIINKHNRASPDPLRLQLGYDPHQGLAQAGASLSF